MTDRIVVPHFENESDEADWWFDNRHEHDEIMIKAINEGRTITLKNVLERHGLEAPPMDVRIDPDDISRARTQAAKQGVQYDDYIRHLLHQALLSNDAA